MSEIPIRVPVRLPHEAQRDTTVETHTKIDMRLGAQLRGASRLGLILVIVGSVTTTVALLFFAYVFPQQIFAFTVDKATARLYIKAIVLAFGGGATLVMLGSSLFFYGRSVVGRAVGSDDTRTQPVEASA